MIIIKMTAAANVEPLGTPKLSWREREGWGVGTGIFSLSEWKAGAIFLVSLSKAAVRERRAPSLSDLASFRLQGRGEVSKARERCGQGGCVSFGKRSPFRGPWVAHT